MAESKKYYWLKLNKDFFKRQDIKVVESMPNGKDYVLFYLKLLCESVSFEGYLKLTDRVPYNEQMLATITGTNIDIVRASVQVFTELGLMSKMDDGTIFMQESQKMLGCETEWAKKKRAQRTKALEDKTRTLIGQSEDNVPQNEDIVRQEYRDKSIENREKNINKKNNAPSVQTPREMITASDLPEEIKASMLEWVDYKKEQFRFNYKPIGLNKLINEVRSKVNEIGPQAVKEVINKSITRTWQGITWECLKDNRNKEYGNGRGTEESAKQKAEREWRENERRLTEKYGGGIM